ncbi:MAG: EAL domain-containing protein [Gallionellaceae bacterium]|jgi:diguanylate cyclase (GGDEF)-like protein/PAS domain S-box-containing protein|nr:EAL domain-containing protein [Gallionellaceae bacterium]
MAVTDNGGVGKIVQALFFPVIALLNRLGYTQKFTLLWLLSMVATTVVMYSLLASLDRVIQPSQRELECLALIKPISRVVQLIQLHRGMSAALLGGNEAMRDGRAAKESEIAGAFKAMEEALPPRLVPGESFQHIKENWARLRKEGLHWTAADNLAAHTGLIDQIQSFEVAIADDYGLTMDMETGTFYLIDTSINKLPHALEHLGQIRAYAAGILASKQASEQQKVKLHTLIAGLDNALRELNANLEKTSRHNPALRASLMKVHKDVADSAQRITSLVKSDILAGHFATPSNDFLSMATAEIDSSYSQLYESLLPAVETLLRERIAKAKNMLRETVGISLLLLLAVVYFTVSMYYAIIGSIQLLARSARAFASGDLSQRVNLRTRDELSLVGDSFNEMADGFNAMLEARYEDEARLRATIETAMDAVVQMDANGLIVGWNTQAEKIFGWSREEAVGQVLSEIIIPPQYRKAHIQGLERFLHSGEGTFLNTRVEIVGLHRDGHEFPVELAVAALKTTSGKMRGEYEFSAFIRDITRKKESEEMIWRQANFDTLTGLPNRHMFYDRLEQDIKKSQRADLKVALLFIDLDKFKEVNDTLGHSMGDLLLKSAARRIGDCVREADTVARLGGDEFIVILAELENTEIVERVTENILRKLAEPFRLDGNVAYVSASIGITLYPSDATGVEELLKNADQAMYTAKDGGRNRFSYFTQPMQQAAQKRLQLVNDLRGALAADQFKVYYQPIVELSTGRIHKAEALIRWQHPKHGMVSPAEFIPMAEEAGLIVEIGDWVFKEAARQAKQWRMSHNTGFEISVNISPVQFRSPNCMHKMWAPYLQKLELPWQSIAIEITEGLLLDTGIGVIDRLRAFRDAGAQISIDDFGTGYSSLSYLKKFDIDYLKIDQSFVRDLEADPDDMALCEAIIVMAHKLGLKVIAEGVETEAQRKLLAAAGCDYAQGYLYSRPVPAAEFEVLLKGNWPLDQKC